MTYTIKEASDITGIPATTLRYYDKEGILPFLERKESGHRMFSEQDRSATAGIISSARGTRSLRRTRSRTRTTMC